MQSPPSRGHPRRPFAALRAGSARHVLGEARRVQQRPHAVQGIDTVPRFGAALLGEEPLGGHAVDGVLRTVAQYLRQGCCQVVGVARGDAVLCLGDKHAVTVVDIARRTCREDTVEGIVGVALRAVGKDLRQG